MTKSILKNYVAAAHAHGDASQKGDYEKANEAYERLISALLELRQSNDKGAILLKEMLNNKDSYVRCAAATHLLPLEKEVAISALEQLAADQTSLAGFNAKMVLREWRAGKLKVG